MYQRTKKSWVKHLDFILLDLVMINIAYLLAFWVRQYQIQKVHWSDMYQTYLILANMSGLIVSLIGDSHKNILKRGFFSELWSVVKYVVVVMFVLLGYDFFVKMEDYSRGVLGYFAIFSCVLILAERVLWKKILVAFHRIYRGKAKRMLLYTTPELAAEAAGTVLDNSFGEYELVGAILEMDGNEAVVEAEGEPAVRYTVGESVSLGEKRPELKIVSNAKNAISFIQSQWVDEILVYLPQQNPVPERFLETCAVMGLVTHLRLHLQTERNSEKVVEKVAGCTVITETLQTASTRQVMAKRILDIVGSLVGLVFTLLLTIIIGPIIFVTDPGPIFFSQKRIGQNGKVFRIYKFRSMYKDAEKRKAELMSQNEMKGLMFKMENDPRVLGSGPDGTRHGIGWFIRKTSIDEFPQFLNVLKGDLSLVGTRPPTLDEWERYEPHHRARLAIKPGLTGLWQVSGRSDITDFEEVIALDMKYINNWSFGEDLRILFRTVLVLFTGKGAK